MKEEDKMNKKFISLILSLFIVLTSFPTEYVQATSALNDIKGHWAEVEISRWVEKGIIEGYEDGTIKPNDRITRAEFVSLINRIVGYSELSQEQFLDVDVNAWYADDIKKARAAEYIRGYNNQFRPDAFMIRQDAAVILAKVFEINSSNQLKFNDHMAITEYAQDPVGALLENGYLKGYEDGTFRPGNYITRAETAKILSGIIAALYNEAGNVSSEVINGNVMINTPGVILENTVIQGDLYLTVGIQEGDVILDGVEVKGTVFVNGGGSNSVYFRNTILRNVIVNKKGNEAVRVVTSGNTSIENVTLKSPAKLEEKDLTGAGFTKVLIDSAIVFGAKVEFVGDFGQVDVQGKGTKLVAREARMNLKISADFVTVNDVVVENSKSYTVDRGKKVTEGPTSSSPSGPSSPSSPSSPSNPSNPSNPTNPVQNEWQLVWRDEFNGSEINMDNWSYDLPTNGRYNGEIQSYTQNNAFIEDGSLVIEARKEDITEPSGETYNYSSGKLITKGKQNWTYGKVEVKAKMPTGQGIWPAIWMMPEDEQFYGTWPKCGEIDIMELLGQTPNKVYGTIHYGEPHKESQGTYLLPEGESFGDDYYVYSMEWEPGEIRWYIDGVLFHTANDWYSNDSNNADDYTYPAPFDQDFFLIMNISVGGGWPGNPDDTTVFPQQMAVDYVRVYQKDEYPLRVKPDNEESEARGPLEDGNYIYNGDFSGDIPFATYWEFLEGPAGAAEVIVNEGAIHVQIENGGTADYSIQVIQKPINLEKGAKYKAVFEAKGAAERSLKVKIGGDGDRGWKDYAQEPRITVSTDWKTYEFEFTMNDDSDVKARYEFNMGLDHNDMWIRNVKLIKVADAPIIDPSTVVRKVLQTGNYIYNGTFDQGEGRMGYWDFIKDETANATYYVGSAVNERIFEARINNGGESAESVQLIQSGLNMENGKIYQLQFEASAEEARTIQLGIQSDEDGGLVYNTTLDIEAEKKLVQLEFTLNKTTDAIVKLVFNLGGNDSDVSIDNVFMQKKAVEGVEGNLLKNGIFDDLLSWTLDANNTGEATFEKSTGNQLKASISNVGTAGYNVQVYQDGVHLEKGETYEVSFDAQSTIDRAIIVQLQKTSDWTPYLQENVSLTNVLKPYTYTFTMTHDTDLAPRFSFALGNVAGTTYDPHEIYIDNVVIKKVIPITDLILNGTFDASKDHWEEYWGGVWEDAPAEAGNGTATGTATIVDGELEIAISTLGIKDYTPQIKQGNLSLEVGQTYTLTFSARALEARAIKVDVLDTSYAWYGGTTFDLTTDDKVYTLTFEASKSINDGVLSINFGTIADETSNATTVYLDNISLIKE